VLLLFNFALKIFSQEGSRNRGRIGIEWNTSATGLCRWC